MPLANQQLLQLGQHVTITVTFPDANFVLPLDASDPKAWQDLLNYIIAHPELVIALLQLLAMLLGGITPPPPPTR